VVVEGTAGPETARQLEWEARMGRLTGLAALGALVLPLAGQLLLRLGIDERPRDAAQFLGLVNRHRTEFVLAAGGQVLGLLLLGGALAFLVRASRVRRAGTPAGALAIVAVGTLAVVGATIAQLVALQDVAADFLAAGPRTPARAEQMFLSAVVRSTTAQIGQGANIAFGLALVLTGVSAMRAGLLSRFMGVLAIVVGVLGGIFGFQQAFLLLFWAGALSLILLDRWPGGRGPAWVTGEATPWPSAAERRAALEREQEPPPSASRPEPADREGDEEERPRKRKRRRR
jgi:hypothetical protein